MPMKRSGVLRSKLGAAPSKKWSRDLTINHQNPWQNKHKTDRTLHRIPQGENRLQKNIVRSHHKRMCATTMLTLKNLCNIYEFDFIWSILKKPFNVMRNILDDCNDMFAALRATAVLRQLFTWYLKKHIPDICQFWGTTTLFFINFVLSDIDFFWSCLWMICMMFRSIAMICLPHCVQLQCRGN